MLDFNSLAKYLKQVVLNCISVNLKIYIIRIR